MGVRWLGGGLMRRMDREGGVNIVDFDGGVNVTFI